MSRIFLSAPDVRAPEKQYLEEAVASNWIAPAGPDLALFEHALAEQCDREFGVALTSGTAALHLALLVAGVQPGDDVLCSTLTFVASANAIHYTGARPVFVDSEVDGWNIDPQLVCDELDRRAAAGNLPAAIVVVDLYGQCARYDAFSAKCDEYGVTIIEDSAEALGSTRHGHKGGSFGVASILSFNGNKIITASGGGALVTDDPAFAQRVRHLATQAREPFPHYEHIDRGYNYRLSNLLAAFGRGQLENLDKRVGRRREFNQRYRDLLADRPGVSFLDEAEGNFCTFWLTALTIDPTRSGTTSAEIIDALEAQDIESRPVWKPMHLQPAYAECESVLNGVSEQLFTTGLCLPSGSGMSDGDFERVLQALDSVVV